MHEVAPKLIWVGHAGDLRLPQLLLHQGIGAVVDLAANEAIRPLPRELIYARFPLVDGSGNPPELLRLAVNTTTSLMCDRVPTLLCCSAGMSRSLAIAALAWAKVHRLAPEESLRIIARSGSHDVSAALWRDVRAACFKGSRWNGSSKRNRPKSTKRTEVVAGALTLARIVRSLPATRFALDYDAGADVLYISLDHPRKATNTIELEDGGILLDYRGRNLVGIDVLNASTR